tara:strand:+ start:4872 stop:5306 length:435 start_codon:yes stop_codon:yes gene_type:complete
MKRVFFAHSAQTDVKDVRNNSKRLKEMLERLHDDTYKVVAGRQDYQSYFRGDWDIWQKGVVNRTDAVTGAPVYNIFVVLGKTCGRATAGILKAALEAGRPVLRWDGAEVLDEVTEVRSTDPDDWQTGYKLYCPAQQLGLFEGES